MKENRKKMRKQKRKEKKQKRQQFFSKSKSNNSKYENNSNHEKTRSTRKTKTVKTIDNTRKCTLRKIEDDRKKEQKLQEQLQNHMKQQRKVQLIDDNKEEDILIRKLEKNLNLHKRKTKALPKSFIDDGLAYMIEAAELGNSLDEPELNETNDDFKEDFLLIAGNKEIKGNKYREKNRDGDSSNYDDDFDTLLDEDDFTDDESHVTGKITKNRKLPTSDGEISNSLLCLDLKSRKRKSSVENKKETHDKPKKRKKGNDSQEETADDSELETDQPNQNSDGIWEDIYGRFRTKDGAVIDKQTETSKYIPPAVRAKMEQKNLSADKKQKIEKLKKQLKGLLNRLAESNMHSIANEIEIQYTKNSRNDMNDTLCNLIMESLVSSVITPERLLMEHVLLIAILHANVGNEVGAHFLQKIVEKFNNVISASETSVEDKTLGNLVNILSQMYNFKIFDAKLLYEILNKLTEQFTEKNIECILLVLKSVGFGLRKDDPLALKNFILEIQKRASDVGASETHNSRVKFLLEIVLAIKNNNVTKIPNYDTSYSEHLKKIMKGFIRKGNYISQLNISLDDLLKADERGKWWVVGSAWTGNTEKPAVKKPNERINQKFPDKLLHLAKKQRMNTETRRDIFCTILSSENYMDAFEKLLKLNLKYQQERDIINIILHCCLTEKTYNPFYTLLAEKFCEYHRRFQMTLRCSIWDKLKALNNHSKRQISNLAKMLVQLLISNTLPITVLKIIEFRQIRNLELRFIRLVLVGVLLHKDIEKVQKVFEKIAYREKLNMFREGIRLFINYWLVKNLKPGIVPDEERFILNERIRMVENILTTKDFQSLKM